MMDDIDEGVISSIKQSVNSYTKKMLSEKGLPIDVVFYDLTTIYFEVNNKDDLRQFGFSKDGKSQHVQITLALLVTNSGLPIGYEIFPGNTYEGHTVSTILDKLEKDYKIKKVVVVADSGLLNKDNISLLESKNYQYIISARIKNMKAGITKDILDKEDYIDIDDGISAKVLKYDSKSSLICCYSKKKARKDEYEREQKIKKITKKIGKKTKEFLASKYQKSFITIKDDSKVELNQDSINKAKRYDGLFAMITNIKNPKTKDIIFQYKGLWQIERSFRIIKSNLSIRPVFHWSADRVKAHFAICYISFALVRALEFNIKTKGLNITKEQVHDALDGVVNFRIKSKNNIFSFAKDMTQNAKDIYKATNTKIPYKFKAS